MTSSSNDRKMLHDLISDAYRRAPWGTDVFEYVADAILTKFLPGYTERVKAEQREADAQIAESEIVRSSYSARADVAAAIREAGKTEEAE